MAPPETLGPRAAVDRPRPHAAHLPDRRGRPRWNVRVDGLRPAGQGIRLFPMPPQGGNVWLCRLFGQARAPLITKMGQKLDPVPDDQIKWFRDGFIAYAHRHSSSPQVKARFPQMKAEWQQSMMAVSFQNAREKEAHGEFPDRPLLSPAYYYDPGPGDPYWKQRGFSQ